MAASAVTGVVNQIDFTGKNVVISGTLAVGAGDYAAGGLVVDIAAFSYGAGQGVPAMGLPINVRIYSQPAVASAAIAIFIYSFLSGSTLSNGRMQVFTGAAAQSGLAELADGATPAGITGDAIKFSITCPRITA